MYEDLRKSLEHLGKVLTNQKIESYSINQDDYDVLNNIWWELEGIPAEDSSKNKTEDCQDDLLTILQKMDKQKEIKNGRY